MTIPTRALRRHCTRRAWASSSSISPTRHAKARSGTRFCPAARSRSWCSPAFCCSQPELLFLDEATGALDPDAKIAFHQAIKDTCQHITVISVMHEQEPPKAADGASFYDSIVVVADGMAAKRPLVANSPVEVPAVVQEFPGDGARIRLARMIRAKGRRPGLR